MDFFVSPVFHGQYQYNNTFHILYIFVKGQNVTISLYTSEWGKKAKIYLAPINVLIFHQSQFPEQGNT